MIFKPRARFAAPTASALPDHKVSPSERVYAVGDIHGRYDLLMAMLEEISSDIARFSDHRHPRIIFLGDYIDRGDQSREVVEMLSDIAGVGDRLLAERQVQVDFLAGNHEIALLNFLDDPAGFSDWLKWGGLQTLASFGLRSNLEPNEAELHALRDKLSDAVSPHMSFLTGLQKMTLSGDVVFVHADLAPDVALDAQPEEAMIWGYTGFDEPQGVRSHRMIHGHYASDQPVSLPHRICIDTGAYFSGRLTAVRLDETEQFLTVER